MKKSRVKKVKLGEFDFILFAAVMSLLVIGLIMVYSASSWTAMMNNLGSSYYFKKQLIWAIIGIFSMMFAMAFDYHKIKKITNLLLFLCIPLLLIVFKFTETNGAHRWIDLKFMSIQPSEIAKYVMVFYAAKAIELKGENIKKFFKGVVPILMVTVFYAGLVYLENNLSITGVIIMSVGALLFLGGARLAQLFGIVVPLGIAAGLAGTFLVGYRHKRVLGFLDPFGDSSDKGLQLVQSLLALGSGGIHGLGLGQSRQKAFYIPEAHTDFIFSITGEELGYIGCLIIIIIFMVFAYRGIRIAVRAKDKYGSLLAAGITIIIVIQSLINIAVVSGSMPVTGVPLPFISYGGSSLVINLAAIGVLLNVSRQIKQ